MPEADLCHAGGLCKPLPGKRIGSHADGQIRLHGKQRAHPEFTVQHHMLTLRRLSQQSAKPVCLGLQHL